MTRTAIISDIHSNWQALRSVWSRIEELNCDQIFCLGDIVGYGARPLECLKLLRDNEVPCVQGNHDALVSDGSQNLHFNEHSLVAVDHNRALLSPEQLAYLAGLPTLLKPEERVFLAHGSPEDRDRYLVYRQDFRQVSSSLFSDGGPGVCFFGHTHFPVAYDGDSFLSCETSPIDLNKDEMMLFNPGSVGQPRDGDPRASFLVWDSEAETVTFERVKYDVDRAREEILAAGLPDRLANRLLAGR